MPASNCDGQEHIASPCDTLFTSCLRIFSCAQLLLVPSYAGLDFCSFDEEVQSNGGAAVFVCQTG